MMFVFGPTCSNEGTSRNIRSNLNVNLFLFSLLFTSSVFRRVRRRNKGKMRKKVDERIRTLIENGVKSRHRSMLVIIGDKSLDQVYKRVYICLNTYSCIAYVDIFMYCLVISNLIIVSEGDMKFIIIFIFLKQILHLHQILSKSVVKSRPSVLWCYKDKLDLSRFSNFISFFFQVLAICKSEFMHLKSTYVFMI